MATVQVRGTAEQFLVLSDRGYAVLRVRLANGETVRAVGRISDIALGSECEFVGRYQFHAEYGREFHVESYRAQVPTSLLGIERFLASGRFKGIGPKTAKRIVEHFAEKTLDILREQPEEIAKVPGLTAKRAKAIVTAFAEQEGVAKLGAFFRAHGLPLHLADKVAAKFGGGRQALDMVMDHPFQLIEEITGIGFKTADGIARALGMKLNDPDRLRAALLYTLSQAVDEGHMGLPHAEWIVRTEKLLSLPKEELAAAGGHLIANGRVVLEQMNGELFVYLLSMYRVETKIALRLRELVQTAAAWDDLETPAPKAVGEILTPLQRQAARAIFTYPLVVLTGGPGTGKTTTVRKVVEDAQQYGLRVVLCAPTGRAAKRLADSTGQVALTIHRLLEVGQQGNGHYGFARNRGNRVEGDVFIIDEASMVDAPLFSHLLDALPDGARLLLVGDPWQLPSVGPGQVLRDVIASGMAVVHELQLVFRQAEQSAITRAAHEVRKGKFPDFEKSNESDYYFIQEEDPKQVAALVVDLAARRLPSYLALDARTGIQVLAPMRKGYCGTERLNEALSKRILSETSRGLQVGPRVFRVGDKVMNIKNDYERDIYNGDIGFVTRIQEEGLTLRVGFSEEAREVELARADCGQLIHAYAVSVHKSQGSEYPCVVLPLVREHAVMLYRQLLYTAMTRAKLLLVIVGSLQAFELALRRVDAAKRFTRLVDRLQAES
ncbi:hypothetical protein BM613_09325 [Sulfoacidibacillus thermotolerans]|uniref:ATP-dependent RecD2 DNA helicase n=2 Tax=Sulfoacidibacillus thermotolerans TaxID=1765684 RepID=A0A2U3D7P5_SULT2|nr:hypothetical protein BM613_09325 [Sulfoacidibacillus thermotolerans]